MYRPPFEYRLYNLSEACALLKSRLRLGIDPRLETVVELLEILGHPDTYFSAIQIAGTNGKTSTSRFCAHILKGEGKRVALYTSPELVRYPERMEIDGHVVADDEFAWAISVALEAANILERRYAQTGLSCPSVTEFDLLTVGACALFAYRGVEIAVLECGLGGRWDATSACAHIKVVAATSISFDHMHILGNTLPEIAGEKAAIFSSGRIGIISSAIEDNPVLAPVFHDAATSADIPLHVARFEIVRAQERIGGPLEITVSGLYDTYAELAALKPAYQAGNIAVAVLVAEAYLGRALDSEKLYFSVVRCPTPGRFDTLAPEPLVLADSCHNPESIRAFLSAIEAVFPQRDERPVALFASLADKDVSEIFTDIQRVFPRIYLTQTASLRVLDAYELERIAKSQGVSVEHVSVSVAEALEALEGECFVGFGSITLAGELCHHYRG